MGKTITCDQIVDASPNGVVAVDSTARIVYANRRAASILGKPRNSLIGAQVAAEMPLSFSFIEECLRSGEPQLGRQIKGKAADVVLTITPVLGEEGISGALCVFQETEYFEEAAAKLESYKRQNMLLEAVFETSSDGIWVYDSGGTVLKINKAAERIEDIKAQDVVGKSIHELMKAGLFENSCVKDCMDTRRTVSVLTRWPRLQKTVLATAAPAVDDEGNVSLIVVNIRDMTELATMKEDLERERMVAEKLKEEFDQLNLLELRKQQIVAESEQVKQLLAAALKLSRLNVSNVLILGESGTGKGLLARFMHNNSGRKKNPFVQVNCAALPETLMEAELFGYEKGAFTGAREQGKAGLVEVAEGGTLFLDEIGDMPLPLQAKLLKYLDDQEVMRLGGTRSRKVECTVIAATNRDLASLAKEKKFREDLYYRLNTFTVKIPALRERPEDIFQLTMHYLRKFNDKYRLERRISPKGMVILQSHQFRGNIRELKNVVEQAVVMSESDLLDDFIVMNLGEKVDPSKRPAMTNVPEQGLTNEVMSVERETLRAAMEQYSSTRAMAKHLGISHSTVVRKMKKYGLSRSQEADGE